MGIKVFFKNLKCGTKNVWLKTVNALKTALMYTAKFFKTVGARLFSLYCKRPLVFCIISAVIIAFYIETVSRHSLWESLKFTFLSPLVFLCGALIVLSTLAISLILKRGIAMYTTMSLVWILLGTTNGVILSNRPSPFAAADLFILPTVLEIITVYLTVPEIIIIVIGILAVITGIVFMWIKAPKREISWKKDLIKLGSVASLLGAIIPTFLATGVISKDYSDIVAAYERNGFPYSFSKSTFTRGITRPSGYSKKWVSDVLDRIDEKKTENDGFTAPNIIYVQLESLFDINKVKGVTFSEDPTPNFNALKESCPSGFLSVPLIGSGTANTEFEILTGMSTEYFSPGEYPYITIMRDTVCESTPFVLSKNGYKTHAMHNNTGVFYDRHLVYPNLGFDTFTSIEYMYDVEYNELGWAKDSVYLEEIQRTLESTPERDFVFTVSVQPHGEYPAEKVGDYGITVSGLDHDEVLKNMYSYYVGQIRDTDKLVGELTEFYSNYSEDTVIVFYGDHLPALMLDEDDLSEGNLYQTEYILWSNFGAFENVPDKDIEAFQLSAYLFELLGLNENIGVIGSVHRYLSDEEDYREILYLMGYDALFGKNYSNKGSEYVPTEMTFGVTDIKVTGVALDSETLTVSGEWFNPFSVVYINGERYETKYVSREKLVVEAVKIKKGNMVTVAQETDDKEALSVSAGVAYVP